MGLIAFEASSYDKSHFLFGWLYRVCRRVGGIAELFELDEGVLLALSAGLKYDGIFWTQTYIATARLFGLDTCRLPLRCVHVRLFGRAGLSPAMLRDLASWGELDRSFNQYSTKRYMLIQLLLSDLHFMIS